jgi:hypothetical protein
MTYLCINFSLGDYWNSVIQNAIGCALGSAAAIGIAIWIYRRQYRDNEKSRINAAEEIERNTLKYFSISIQEIITLVKEQIENNEEFLVIFRKDILDFPLITYLPLFPIKRIIDNTALDKILISYINKFSSKENVIKEFSELISILDYLYLELASLPELLERGIKYDHERQVKFSDGYKKVWDYCGAVITGYETTDTDAVNTMKGIIAKFNDPNLQTDDIKYFYKNIIVPVNEYSVAMLESGRIYPVVIELAKETRDCKSVYADIIKHNKHFIEKDFLPISNKIKEEYGKLIKMSKDLLDNVN